MRAHLIEYHNYGRIQQSARADMANLFSRIQMFPAVPRPASRQPSIIAAALRRTKSCRRSRKLRAHALSFVWMIHLSLAFENPIALFFLHLLHPLACIENQQTTPPQHSAFPAPQTHRSRKQRHSLVPATSCTTATRLTEAPRRDAPNI